MNSLNVIYASRIFRHRTVCRKKKNLNSNLTETNIFSYAELSDCEESAHGYLYSFISLRSLTSDEAKAARAAKFATNGSSAEKAEESSEPIISASGKKLIVFGNEDASKLKRAARFAAAT